MLINTISCRYFQRAFSWAIPIGGLAGLIGLGGGEFRLPVLTQLIGFSAKAAVPINLLISLVTLAFALVVRNHAVPLSGVEPHIPEMLGLAVGGVISAIFGARLVLKLSNRRLTLCMAVMLAALGVLLLVEAFIPLGSGILAQESAGLRMTVAIALGLIVGIVSSMLGVAGGELLIPALLFVFGADIRVAGTASLLVSLLIVSTGLWRFFRAGALQLTGGAPRIVGAMSTGSLIGAALGAFALSMVNTDLIKVLLGLVLILAAAKTAQH